ncbi:hypothetical protein Scep_026081 [Stephania cephalantha]|uniref:Uncharacterized protein n=1 Tax=Stephania cephalantha TaxID=152367 RepID=A0AAP0EMN9_9MAGN
MGVLHCALDALQRGAPMAWCDPPDGAGDAVEGGADIVARPLLDGPRPLDGPLPRAVGARPPPPIRG